MQYLLTDSEYRKLEEKSERVRKLPSEADLQKLCTKIADTMPVDAGWRDKEPSPWGCILTNKHEWYCDKCPVQDICPLDHKNWSK